MTRPEDDDRDVETALERAHEHVVATGERPVEGRASAWLGEAESVLADVALDPDPPAAAVRTRLDQARHLLDEVDATGDPAADDHLEAARDLLARAAERLDGDG